MSWLDDEINKKKSKPSSSWLDSELEKTSNSGTKKGGKLVLGANTAPSTSAKPLEPVLKKPEEKKKNLGQKALDLFKPTEAFKKVAAPVVDTGMNALGTFQDYVLNTSANIMNVPRGRPLQYKQGYNYKEYAKDITGKDVIGDLKKKNAFVGSFVDSTASIVTDPLTYIGGGIVDDFARAGKVGKSAVKGTTENLVLNAERNASALSKGKKVANEVTETIVEDTAKRGFNTQFTDRLKKYTKDSNGNLIELSSNNISLNKLPDTTKRIVSSASQEKMKPVDRFRQAYQRIVDNYSPIKRADELTHVKATNSRNAGGTVDYILTEGLADKSGKTIGRSLKEVAKDIPQGQEKEFWDYMLHKHNVSRVTQEKPIFSDFTPDMSTARAKAYEQKFPEFAAKAKGVRNFLDTFMDEWGVKSGLVSSDNWKAMRDMYPDYIPTNRAFDEIEQGYTNFGKRGFVDQTSPVRKATGSDRDVLDPLENIMNQVNRTVRTARYNEVGQSLLDGVRKSPDKLRQFAEEIPVKDGMFANTDNIVTVMENGKPVYLQLNDKSMLEAMKGMYAANPGDIERIAKKATGVFKSLITQKNPIFAIRNIARDLPTAYIYGSEKNPLKFGAELLGAGKDILTNADSVKQYRALGGGGANFFKSDNVAKTAKELTKGKNILGKIGDGIEYFNNLTESAPRLAEFKRVLEKTGDVQKALFASSDVTTNFARGGDLTKKVDAFVPYLNAGVQGLDKLARSLDPRDPGKVLGTLVKGGIAITVPTAFFHYLNKDNPKYQQLDNRTKDTYFLIPTGDTFIKIPKSRELGVIFGSLFERIARVSEGDKEVFKGFGGTVATNFSPSNPIENNILAPFTYNMPTNKDFAGREIVPSSMKDRSPRYQYDERTTEIAKKIGDMANLSPKQIDYIIKSYTGVIAQIGSPLATKSTYESGNPLTVALKPITSQFIADPLYSNQVLQNFYENRNKLTVKANDKNFVEKLPSKLLTPEEKLRGKFDKASKQISDLNKKIKETKDETEIRRMRQQIIDIAKTTNELLK